MQIGKACKLAALALALVALAMFVAKSPAKADESGNRAAVEAVISQQMEAFKRDDAAAAYAFASPGIKALFPDPGSFIAMVQRRYAPVYRPRSVAFGELKATADGLSQTVAIIDNDGAAWTAIYTLARDPDGQWRITGCVLLKTPETSA